MLKSSEDFIDWSVFLKVKVLIYNNCQIPVEIPKRFFGSVVKALHFDFQKHGGNQKLETGTFRFPQ